MVRRSPIYLVARDLSLINILFTSKLLAREKLASSLKKREKKRLSRVQNVHFQSFP